MVIANPILSNRLEKGTCFRNKRNVSFHTDIYDIDKLRLNFEIVQNLG